MFFLVILSGTICFLFFFSDLLFGWNRRTVIQVSSENLYTFQEIDQPFFDFQSFDIPNGNIQLLEEDSIWILKNGEQLSYGLKKELMKICMAMGKTGYEETGASFIKHLLILFSCLILFFNACVLTIEEDIQCFCFKDNLRHRVEIFVLLCRLIFVDFMVLFVLGICLVARNIYDSGKGWLLCMKKYGLIEQLYTSLSLFFYDHASKMRMEMILILFLSLLLSLVIYKICSWIINKRLGILILMGLMLILFLLHEFLIFSNHFPDLTEYMPVIGIIFQLKDICENTYTINNVIITVFIHSILLVAL